MPQSLGTTPHCGGAIAPQRWKAGELVKAGPDGPPGSVACTSTAAVADAASGGAVTRMRRVPPPSPPGTTAATLNDPLASATALAAAPPTSHASVTVAPAGKLLPAIVATWPGTTTAGLTARTGLRRPVPESRTDAADPPVPV